MRILIIANAPFAKTGYGGTCANLARILQILGHDVAVYCNYGLAGGRLNMNGVTLYPVGRQGDEVMLAGAHLVDHKADVCVSIQDMWTLPENFRAHFPEGVKWLSWIPVDHQPPAPGTVHWAKKVDVPISYTECGRDALRRAGVHDAEHIPLPIDTEVFTAGDRTEARQALGWDGGGFVAVIIGMNKSPRKAYPEQMEAFARFADERSDLNTKLYVHANGLRNDGLDLHALADSLGISDRIIWANRYTLLHGYPPEYMVNVYRAASVLLAATHSEGFGLPIVEAQACGCPVITSEWTSMPELTFNGVCTPVCGRVWTPLSSWWGQPDIDSIEAALLHIAAQPSGIQDARGVDAQRKIVENYSVPAVTERWHELLGAP